MEICRKSLRVDTNVYLSIMKKYNFVFAVFCALFMMVGCQDDHNLSNEKMVYFNMELTPISEIDTDANDLSILYANPDQEEGMYFNDDELMYKWLGEQPDGSDMVDQLSMSDALHSQLEDENLLHDGADKGKRERLVQDFIDENFNTNSRTPVHLKVYTNQGFTGDERSYYGPFVRFTLPSNLDENIESFKAWSAPTPSPFGTVSFYKKRYTLGARKIYFVYYFRKKANLEGWNNETRSLSHL